MESKRGEKKKSFLEIAFTWAAEVANCWGRRNEHFSSMNSDEKVSPAFSGLGTTADPSHRQGAQNDFEFRSLLLLHFTFSPAHL